MQDHGPVTHQHIVLDRAPFEMNQMAHDTATTDDGRVLVGDMNDRTILNRSVLTYLDTALSITPKYRRRPYGGTGTDGDVSNHRRLRVNKGGRIDLGLNVP